MSAITDVAADPPLPPNWDKHLEETIASLAPYKLFPIANDTLEYATLSNMVHPLQIVTAEQIVNPNLWLRFINTRKYMLLTKSDDLELISKLELSEKQVMQQMHISLSFSKDAQLATYPYTDNMALLFHCTRSANNIDNILLQGLDERVGIGGLLGRGIYFADDPTKSMSYDGSGITMLIFMVLLGDCLSVDHLNNKNAFVREPEKQRVQQRNLNDIHFDSIVGRPSAGRHSEYVVYNRYQCCPLYKIRYAAGSLTNGDNIYFQSRNRLPPFGWIPTTSGSIPMPSPLTHSDWIFYAKSIFTQMGVQQLDEEILSEVEILETVESIENKLTTLTNLGFTNGEMNLEALKKNSYDLNRSVDHLLELGAMIDQPTESEILNNNKLSMLISLGFTEAEINSETLESNPSEFDKKVKHLLSLHGVTGQTSKLKVLRGTTTNLFEPGRLSKCSKNINNSEGVTTSTSTESIEYKLAILKNLGFVDDETNLKALRKSSYDLEKSVNHLLEMVDQPSEFHIKMDQAGPGPSTSFKSDNIASTSTVTTSTVSKQPEECLICCSECDMTENNWIVLQCSHKLCVLCYKQIETTRTTMGGVTQTFTKCPFCMKISGVEIGTCPNGTMKTWVVSIPCKGYETYGTICIHYDIKDPVHQLSRIAYLPNNKEGNEVLSLLQIAWDRRICFSIGTSGTTGENNVLVWNIHHKSSQKGGVQCHGFPDDTYMKRAKLELKAYGIE